MSTNSPITVADGWFKAEDKSFVFNIVGPTGTPQDITGYTIKWVLSATDGGAATLSKTASLTTPASGVCTVAVASTDTSGLTAQDYFYTLWRTDAGSKTLLSYGTATLQASVTVVPS